MLGKLMKYDLRYCLRRFIPLWISALALSVICGLFFRILYSASGNATSWLNILTVLLAMSVIDVFSAISVMTLVFICERFYRGLLGREGYLMNTLPVSPATHIVSKGLNALILEIITTIIAMLSGALLFIVFNPDVLSKGWQAFLDVYRQVEVPAGTFWLILEALMFFLISAAAQILMIYAAFSIGHLAKRRRVLWAILTYIGINFALEVLFTVCISSGLFERLLSTSIAINVPVQGEIAIVLGLMTLCSFLLGTVFFIITHTILKKRLNLE